MCNKPNSEDRMGVMQICDDTKFSFTVTLAPVGTTLADAAETRTFEFQETYGAFTLEQEHLRGKAREQAVVDPSALHNHWRVAHVDAELADSPWTDAAELASSFETLDGVTDVHLNDVYDEEDRDSEFDNIWLITRDEQTSDIGMRIREQYPGTIPLRLGAGRLVVQPQRAAAILSRGWGPDQ